MEFHGKCPNPLWKISMEKFPRKLVSLSSMEFHGKCPNRPWRYFPWNSMEIDVLILHGVPWIIFHGTPWNSMEVFHTGSKVHDEILPSFPTSFTARP